MLRYCTFSWTSTHTSCYAMCSWTSTHALSFVLNEVGVAFIHTSMMIKKMKELILMMVMVMMMVMMVMMMK